MASLTSLDKDLHGYERRGGFLVIRMICFSIRYHEQMDFEVIRVEVVWKRRRKEERK